MHWMRQGLKPVPPVDKSGRCPWPVRFRYCIRRPRPSARCSRVGVISNCAATWIMARSRDAAGCARRDQTVPRQTSNELACPCELSNSPCLYLTAESDSAVYFQPGRVEYPYHPANTAGSNMEGYRYLAVKAGLAAGLRVRAGSRDVGECGGRRPTR